MLKYILLLVPIFLLTGCFEKVVYVNVPGPTKVVYVKRDLPDLPTKPKNINKVVFKKITFDNKVYYGITRNEAVDLSVTILNKEEYCDKLENIIDSLKDDTNATH